MRTDGLLMFVSRDVPNMLAGRKIRERRWVDFEEVEEMLGWMVAGGFGDFVARFKLDGEKKIRVNSPEETRKILLERFEPSDGRYHQARMHCYDCHGGGEKVYIDLESGKFFGGIVPTDYATISWLEGA